jgi:hypothetical protein
MQGILGWIETLSSLLLAGDYVQQPDASEKSRRQQPDLDGGKSLLRQARWLFSALTLVDPLLTASCTPSRGGVQPFGLGGGDGGRSRWREAQDGTLELGG